MEIWTKIGETVRIHVNLRKGESTLITKDQFVLFADIVIGMLLVINIFLTLKAIIRGWKLWAVTPLPLIFSLLILPAVMLELVSAPSSLYLLIIPPFLIGAMVLLIFMTSHSPTAENKALLKSYLKRIIRKR